MQEVHPQISEITAVITRGVLLWLLSEIVDPVLITWVFWIDFVDEESASSWFVLEPGGECDDLTCDQYIVGIDSLIRVDDASFLIDELYSTVIDDVVE